jgi:hypothetical protein
MTMPVFHPTLPSVVLKPVHRGDPPARAGNPSLATLTALVSPSGTVSDDAPVAPAAPPSAIQMQIKALISEQALSLDAEKPAQFDR